MFLQILRALEGLAAEFALVRLQWNVDSNVTRDVIALDSGGVALAPLAGQVEVVSRLASDMALADMFLCMVSRQSSDIYYIVVDSRRVLQVRRIAHHSLPTGIANSHRPR